MQYNMQFNDFVNSCFFLLPKVPLLTLGLGMSLLESLIGGVGVGIKMPCVEKLKKIGLLGVSIGHPRV